MLVVNSKNCIRTKNYIRHSMTHQISNCIQLGLCVTHLKIFLTEYFMDSLCSHHCRLCTDSNVPLYNSIIFISQNNCIIKIEPFDTPHIKGVLHYLLYECYLHFDENDAGNKLITSLRQTIYSRIQAYAIKNPLWHLKML